MKFKVTYTVPFSTDPEIRQKTFEEEISCTDSQSVRKMIYKKYHNANIISLVQTSFF